MFKGIAASPGISLGRALVIREDDINIERKEVADREKEKERFRDALKAAEEQLARIRDIAEEKMGQENAKVFEAHILMLEDPELLDMVEGQIGSEGVNAEYALKNAVDTFVRMLSEIDDEYMRERAADIKDVGRRVQNNLLGLSSPSLLDIEPGTIVVAKDIAPSQTAQMDREKVLGFATDIGGRTSHSAIMARTIGIPAVLGLGTITSAVKDKDLLVLDGSDGVVIINPDIDTVNKYKDKMTEYLKAREELKVLRDAESVTLDGRKVEIAANIGTLENIDGVLENGGEGIGLFRTEFLYMDKKSLPTEEEQFRAYKEAAERMAGKPVIIRTLDIGGDKKLPYLPIGDEMNPFLGYRAIRLCLDRKDIFRAQLRALLRASAYGNIKIMFPMVSGITELKAAKSLVDDVKSELKRENIPFDSNMEIGIMIEIPSAALTSDILAREADFFSIGTNDLIQYTVAVDRMNEKVSNLYDPLHPAVLRLIKSIIDSGHKEGKWVGMCGEMAGEIELIPVLLGMGLDEFSMSASSILGARKIIRNLSFDSMKTLAEEVLRFGSSDEIRQHIKKRC